MRMYRLRYEASCPLCGQGMMVKSFENKDLDICKKCRVKRTKNLNQLGGAGYRSEGFNREIKKGILSRFAELEANIAGYEEAQISLAAECHRLDYEIAKLEVENKELKDKRIPFEATGFIS